MAGDWANGAGVIVSRSLPVGNPDILHLRGVPEEVSPIPLLAGHQTVRSPCAALLTELLSSRVPLAPNGIAFLCECRSQYQERYDCGCERLPLFIV
jgi:hypothetical protein